MSKRLINILESLKNAVYCTRLEGTFAETYRKEKTLFSAKFSVDVLKVPGDRKLGS